ncbi:hypothetical protein TSAR_003093 [Trichomalopsis sarcophagae]|uniref:Uncharacterized protein n=1 Tax=Trichomalopsis sarcophagae TaxID=543379 RepID=A0A232EG39_9HYME|nr:hypothetical protein TSAR_003093 [Trichomalopsis sarcophagae]
MGLQKKRPPQQSRSRTRSPDLRENRFKTSTSRRRSMELQKKQQLPRQSRLRSRSPCGSEDYFEASTPKKSKVMEQEQNEFLSRNDTLLLTQSPDGSKNRRRDVMELQGKQPYRQSRPPRSRSPDGSNDWR